MAYITQTIEEAGDNFDSNITPADYKPAYWSSPDELKFVYCDLCDESAVDTREVLGQAGWLLFTGSALCPQHSF